MNNKQSKLRIIAGKWRSRNITFPNMKTIRPTTDRLRETAFNWLTPYIKDATCLDGFAGSGILGFEALSRGAARVTFVDQLKINIESIKHNANILNTPGDIDAHCENFFSFKADNSVDIVFLDPPYHQGLLIKAMQHLHKQQWIHQHSIIYLEAEKEIAPALLSALKTQGWTPLKQKQTKRVFMMLAYCTGQSINSV